jgi:hypothetical protein
VLDHPYQLVGAVQHLELLLRQMLQQASVTISIFIRSSTGVQGGSWSGNCIQISSATATHLCHWLLSATVGAAWQSWLLTFPAYNKPSKKAEAICSLQ